MKRLFTPLDRKTLADLRAGDTVTLSGTILTGRDAAHRRMVECIEKGEPLPFSIENEVIYYTGPCPAPPGRPIGSCGPTTSYRMDAYAPLLLQAGLIAMIGKGDRSDAVIEAMVARGAVYFAATGGAGALIADCVTHSQVVAWPDLGAEAVHRLTVRDFPLIVAIDSRGQDLYRLGPARYARDGR